MVNIDYIMDLLDWDNSKEEQQLGIQLARTVRCINVFLQPSDKRNNKNVWDNCALILSEKSDEELSPYLIELMEWLQDMNWPGAFCIMERLKKYEKNHYFTTCLEICLKKARIMEYDFWEEVLKQIP